MQHIEETGLATQLKELRGGLILTQIHGTDVARMPMNEAFAIFMKAGRPVTLLFGAPQPDVVATFETEGTLGINFLRSSANPLNLAKIGESGLAAQLPQLRADLLLTHVGDKCVAGVKPPYDGALKMIKDAGRPVTLTFSPLPPDLRPKSQKDPAADDSDDHGVLNLEPMKMSNDVAAVSGSGMPSIHEGWVSTQPIFTTACFPGRSLTRLLVMTAGEEPAEGFPSDLAGAVLRTGRRLSVLLRVDRDGDAVRRREDPGGDRQARGDLDR